MRVSALIAKPFYPVHRAIKSGACREVWLMGGRGSTKSSFVSLEIVAGLLLAPSANAIIYRKVAATLRESVYAQVAWAIGAYGLERWFIKKTVPLEIVYKPTGQKIMFKGADDPGKSKSLKLAKGYFKYLWFEELTEFDGMEDIRTICASALRGSDEKTFTFFSYNPPKSARNWVNQEALLTVPMRLKHHSDYTMVPAAWLGQGFIAQAEQLKATNETVYRHMYLGEVTGTGGQVFDNVTVRPITKEERAGFDRHLNGGDFGFANDPDAFIRMAYRKSDRTLFLLFEIFQRGLCADELATRVKAMLGTETVVCDSEDPRMIHELKRRGITAIGAKKGPGSVAHGMRWLQNLGGIVIDPETCPNAAREFLTYEYQQDRQGHFLSDYKDQDNHLIDAARYGTEALSNLRIGIVRSRDAYGI